MRGKCLDRIDQMPIGIRLEEIAARTSHEYVLNERIVVVHGKDQDLGAGGVCPDLPCCLDAVEERQRIVEDSDIGFGFGDFANRIPTVSYFCNNLPLRVGFEDLSQTRSNHFMVVGNQDAGHVSQQPAPVLTGYAE